MTTIDTDTLNGEDIIDVRDIIERIEELEAEREALADAVEECQQAYDYHDSEDTKSTPEWRDLNKAIDALADWDAHSSEAEELASLASILEDLKGYGGDEQWRGDWYPVTLIRESYFTDYAEELVRDCYDLKGLPTFVHIDWEATAREVMVDYSTVEIDGVTYFYR